MKISGDSTALMPSGRTITGHFLRLGCILDARRDAVLAVMVVLLALPVWMVPVFPSLDGAAHLANALIFLNLDNPDATIFAEFYKASLTLPPNLAVYLFNLAVLPTFGPVVTEKLFLTLYLATFALGLRYCLGAFGAGARIWALPGMVIAFNGLIFLGFYNALLGMVGFLFALGFWLREDDRQGRSTWRLGLGYGLIGFGLYALHLSALGMFCATIGVFSIARVAREGLQGVWVWRRLILPGMAMIPALLAALWYMTRPRAFSPFGLRSTAFEWPDVIDFLTLFGGPALLNLFSETERLVTLPFMIGWVFALRYMVDAVGAKRVFASPWALATLIFALVYLFVPDGMIVRWLPVRLLPYVFVVVFVWLAWTSMSLEGTRRPALAAMLGLAALGSGLVHLAVRPAAFETATELQAEYLEAAAVLRPNSTVLPISLPNDPDAEPLVRFHLMFMAAHRLVLEKPVVNLANLHATANFFPVAFKAGKNPFVATPDLLPDYAKSHDIDPLHVAEVIGHPVDAVVVWGDRKYLDGDQSPETSILRTRLQTHYTLAHETSAQSSAERGLLRVYALKE